MRHMGDGRTADWRGLLRKRLAALRLDPAREREIVDELSQHLEDHYAELRAGGATHDEAVALAVDEVRDEGLLAREMRPLRQASVSPPLQPGTPGRGWLADLR